MASVEVGEYLGAEPILIDGDPDTFNLELDQVDEILSRPRPKTEPPKPPNPQATDVELETWGKGYDKWKDENSHLPNLQPVENIINNFKQRRDGVQQPPVQPPIQNQQALDFLMTTASSSDPTLILLYFDFQH